MTLLLGDRLLHGSPSNLDPEINMEFATLAIREEIPRSIGRLPLRSSKPRSSHMSPRISGSRPFLSYTISGDYPLQKLRELVKTKLELGPRARSGAFPRVERRRAARTRRSGLSSTRASSMPIGIEPCSGSGPSRNRTRILPAGRVKNGNAGISFQGHGRADRPQGDRRDGRRADRPRIPSPSRKWPTIAPPMRTSSSSIASTAGRRSA